MILLDYFFYRLQVFIKKYTQYNKNNPEYYSQCILSLTLILNSFVLLNFIEDYHKNLTISLILFVIIFILIFALIHYRYITKKRCEKLDKYFIKNTFIRLILDLFLFCYIIFSFYIFIKIVG